jgi:peptide/nickel transport system substrate-binding protein
VQTNGYLSMLQSSEVPVVPGTWLYETQSAMYYHSPERALQTLYDDGWGDSNGDGILDRVRDGLLQELSITIVTYSEDTVSTRIHAAEKIAKDLSVIGIRVEVISGERDNVLKALRADDFDLALLGFNLSTVPNPAPLVDTEGNLNLATYDSMEMNKLCDQILTAATEGELAQVFSAIQMRIVDELPIMGLGFHTGAVISHVSLNGLSGIRELDTFNGLELTADR